MPEDKSIVLRLNNAHYGLMLGQRNGFRPLTSRSIGQRSTSPLREMSQ